MSTTYTIWPLRFSPRPEQMIAFYRDLGLHQALSTESGDFASFTGRSGSLGVHSAQHTESGAVACHTSLNFTVPDVAAAAAELQAAGLVVRTWDETYGKQGTIAAADGRIAGLNEDEQQDLYGGYRTHEQTVAASMDVVAVCHTADPAAEAAWFAHLGFTAASVDDPWWNPLRAGTTSGIIGLHTADGPLTVPGVRGEAEASDFGPTYAVRIGFETSEPLDALAARLTQAGHPAEVVENDAGPHVVLTDPDGEEVQIHPTM